MHFIEIIKLEKFDVTKQPEVDVQGSTANTSKTTRVNILGRDCSVGNSPRVQSLTARETGGK